MDDIGKCSSGGGAYNNGGGGENKFIEGERVKMSPDCSTLHGYFIFDATIDCFVILFEKKVEKIFSQTFIA